MTKDGPFWLVVLAVGCGAAIGAVIRWALSYWLNARSGWLPMGTLTANLTAGFLIGLAMAWFTELPDLSPAVRLFVITGFLGGLSTLSTFSAESLHLIMTGELIKATAHLLVHTAGTITCTWLGYSLYRML